MSESVPHAAWLDERLDYLRTQFAKHGQEHVFQFVQQLNQEQKLQLCNDAKAIDLREIDRMAKAITEKVSDEAKISKFPSVIDKTTAPAELQQRWFDAGLDAIAAGKVAAILMGGGQGTRLGFNKPKGLYDIGLPSHKSLLQIQAERIARLRVLAARKAGKDVSSVHLPWYIMTSDFTHQETIDYFKSHNHFGLPAEDFFFFEQGTLPCLTEQGKIILESASKIAAGPNGNGGIYQALDQSLALADMKKRGVEFVHVYGVDNVLAKVADPWFLGACILDKSDCAAKTVRKDDPKEAVGVLCLRNNVPYVIEYSEIDKELAALRDADTGLLVYNLANIANHFMTVAFLDRMSATPLPLHLARKVIPCANEKGDTYKPEKPNGIKMEMFVFDVFAFAEHMVAFQVLREGEFTALKNAVAPGASSTAETARKDLSDYHISLISKFGGQVNTKGDASAVFEISPLVSYDGEDLEPLVKGKTFDLPFELK